MLEQREKEDLILEKIINKNYNLRIFMNFLKKEKENGGNLKNWDLKGLKNVIKFYKDIVNGKRDIFDQSNIFEEKNEKEEDVKKTNSKFYLIDPQEYENEINYNVKMENPIKNNNFFNNKEINFQIDNIQSYYFYFFKDSFYSIKIKEVNWKVNRKFDDFFLLRNRLEKIFPFLIIPNLKKKFIDKKSEKQNLEFFLNSIINNIYLRNSEELILFLKSDRNEFLDNIKKNDNNDALFKINKFLGYFYNHNDSDYFKNIIKSIPSFKNNINLKNSHLLNEFNNDIVKNLIDLGKYEKEILNVKDIIKTNIENLSNNIIKIKSGFQKIFLNFKKLDLYEIKFSNGINNAYQKYEKYFSNFLDDLKIKLDLFNSDFFEYFAYENMETYNLINKNYLFNNLKKKISKLSSFEKKNEIKEDFNTFRTYLNNINKQNFQWTFYNRSKKLNNYFLQNINNQINYQNFNNDQNQILKLETEEFFYDISIKDRILKNNLKILRKKKE